MSLSLDQVRHIANLARLELTAEELARYQAQLSAILDYFQQLQAVDTKDVLPTASVAASDNVLRPDEPHPGLALDDLLRNAPDAAGRQFRVPPVFEAGDR